MLVFIDDSGDAGFKLEKGSTSFFIIAMVIFDDELVAEEASIAIKRFRRQLGWPDYREFRFHKLAREIRKGFLQVVSDFKFRVRVLVVEKKVIRSDELKARKDKFYGYFIKEALKQSGGAILNAKIKIDGSGDRVFRKSFLAYLRRELSSQERLVMRNCRLVDSQGNVLVQLADMIAGSINRSYSQKNDAKEYRAIIERHIEDEWRFR